MFGVRYLTGANSKEERSFVMLRSILKSIFWQLCETLLKVDFYLHIKNLF